MIYYDLSRTVLNCIEIESFRRISIYPRNGRFVFRINETNHFYADWLIPEGPEAIITDAALRAELRLFFHFYSLTFENEVYFCYSFWVAPIFAFSKRQMANISTNRPLQKYWRYWPVSVNRVRTPGRLPYSR